MAGKLVKVREDLKNYFRFVDGTESNNGAALKCLHEDCKTVKPRTFSFKQGWNSHENHLKLKHGIDIKQKKNEGIGSVEQYLIAQKCEQFSNSDCYPKSHHKQIRFKRDLQDLIALAGLPFELVEHPVFIRLVKNLDRSIKVHSRRTVTRRFSEDAKKELGIVKKEIAKIPHGALHFSLDLWTSRSYRSVLGIKIQFIGGNWTMRNLAVGFIDFDAAKTGVNIRETFKKFLTKNLEAEPKQVGIIMTDNAGENIKAFNMDEFFTHVDLFASSDESSSDSDQEIQPQFLNDDDLNDLTAASNRIDAEEAFDELDEWQGADLQRLGCVVHAMQLVIKECLRKNPETANIMKEMDKLISFFTTAPSWHRKLIKLAKKGLIKIGATRWNGFLLSLDRIIEKDFLCHLNAVLLEAKSDKSSKRKMNPPDLISPELENQLKELSQLLTPFLKLSNVLQADGVTSSKVIPGIIGLYKEVASVNCSFPFMKALKSSLCLTLSERFGSATEYNYSGRGARKHLLQVFSRKAYRIATVLDPRFKLSPFQVTLNEPYKLEKYTPSPEAVRNLLDAEVKKIVENLEIIVPSEDVPQSPAPAKKQKQIEDVIWNHLPSVHENSSADASDEVAAFLNEPLSSRETNPLEFWRMKQEEKRFPVLSKLARNYLGFPASSGSVERMFSVAGALCRARRARLSMKAVSDMLIYRDARQSAYMSD